MKNSISLFLFTLVSRIPLLNIGYGPEEDAWGHVLNIYEMKGAGHYIMSRLPGHPIYEGLLYILFPIHSALFYNLLSAIASGFAVLAFYKIALNFTIIKNAFQAALAFAVIPIFYLSSTYTIDYTLGLALTLWAYYLILKHKIVWSALLLALAVGTRITWILMLMPLLATLNGYRFEKFEFKKSFQFLFVFGFLSATAYYPVYDAYGIGFFNTYKLPYPPLAKAIYKGTIGVWGLIGFGFLSVVLFAFMKRAKFYFGQIRWCHIVWGIPIVLYSIIFIRLPEKSAFFIPVIPFLLLFIFSFLDERWIKWSAFIAFCSLLFFGINISDSLRGATPRPHDFKKTISGQEIFFSFERGLFFLEKDKREKKQSVTARISAELNELEKPSAVICGWWYAMLDVTVKDNKWPWPEHVKLHYYLSDEEILKYQENGYELLYLPEQEIINNQKNNSTLTSEVGQPFSIE